jgi:hypothetical protein
MRQSVATISDPTRCTGNPVCLLLTHMVTDGSTGEYATHRISR